jgi:hypothetical protein
MMPTPTAHTLCMPTPPDTCSHPMVEIALLGSHPLMIASTYVRATSYDRAHRARECRRDDCLMVERMEGSAGNKKIPTQGMGGDA